MRWLGLVISVPVLRLLFRKNAAPAEQGHPNRPDGRGEKHGKAFYTELVMKLATYLAVAAEVFSILTAKTGDFPLYLQR